ncbi:hypothetical protein Axi01nite_93220 [Actinoplanes xinjiangensis]|nr:hypothetical protein Axi01nite_93220 [Actinoplanes xinjiangensis]
MAAGISSEAPSQPVPAPMNPTVVAARAKLRADHTTISRDGATGTLDMNPWCSPRRVKATSRIDGDGYVGEASILGMSQNHVAGEAE